MVEQAKRAIETILDLMEAETGTARAPVSLIRRFAVTKAGAKIPGSVLRQARKEMGIESYSIGGIQYWEKGAGDEENKRKGY